MARRELRRIEYRMRLKYDAYIGEGDGAGGYIGRGT